jgi:aminoglycoside phosphotransferase (APT) family kinase protein
MSKSCFGLPEKTLDSKRLEDYLCLTSRYGDFSLIPESASNVRVSNFEKLSGGITNKTYTFLLTFTEKGVEKSYDLVLKAYTENVGLWFKICHPDEDMRPYVREFQALRSLERAGFPVPHVYLCECDSFFLGHPFILIHKEKVIQEKISELDSFASTLARLHMLKVDKLEIRSLRFPKDDSAFAREYSICLKHFLNDARHYRSLKKDFDYAINWLESTVEDNKCPQYCLIHGEYHPGHTLITNDNRLKVIDWEGVKIGDPAFDVGYAYHMVKLMYDARNPNSGERAAEYFVSKYLKDFSYDVRPRIKFYQVVGILGVTIAVSSWISNPLEAYRRFGYQAFARALAFPYIHSNIIGKKWLNDDFIVSYLQYFQDFIKRTLKE